MFHLHLELRQLSCCLSHCARPTGDSQPVHACESAPVLMKILLQHMPVLALFKELLEGGLAPQSMHASLKVCYAANSSAW